MLFEPLYPKPGKNLQFLPLMCGDILPCQAVQRICLS